MKRFALLLALLAPALPQPATAQAAGLAGSEWGFAGETGGNERFITFGSDGRVAGSGGCNRFTGSYVFDSGKLTFSALASTRMACPPEVMEKEQAFFDLLDKVRGVKVDHTLLLFLAEDGTDLRAMVRRDAD